MFYIDFSLLDLLPAIVSGPPFFSFPFFVGSYMSHACQSGSFPLDSSSTSSIGSREYPLQQPRDMGTPLTGTVVITGGNGLLGSEIAVAIAKTQPFVHLLLTARDPKGEDVRNLIARIRLIGPRSIEVIHLDLTDLESVTNFAQRAVDRVRSKEIPPLTTLIHSAAIASYSVDELTLDGYDPVYQTNCVSPFLLTVGLLEAFRADDGTAEGRAKVINIGCSASSEGRLDFFDHNQGRDRRPPGTVLSAREGNIRFGSSKLIASVALYALRRSLAQVGSKFRSRRLQSLLTDPEQAGNISLDIFTLDPGGMTGESHLRARAPLSVRVAHQTRTGLRPILRMVSRSSINKASVPAKAIAKVAFQRDTGGAWPRERYYILDSEYEAGSVISALRDGRQMGTLLVRMMQQVESSKMRGSPESFTPPPTVYS